MSAVVKMGFIANIRSSLCGQVLYSILTGLFGSLLLVLFLSGLMPLADTLTYLPWILAFNAAVAGYTLLDGAADKLKRKKLSGVGVGSVIALMTCALLNLMAWKMTGMMGLMGWPEMAGFIAVAALFGGFGAWLAVKYARIKRG